MKTRNLFAAAVMALAFAAAPAFAADTPSATAPLGIVDVAKVRNLSTAAKDIIKAMEGKREEFHKEVSKEEDSLRSTEKEIMKQKDSLSEDDFKKKSKDYEQRLVGAHKMLQEKNYILDKALNDAMMKLDIEVTKIVAAIAKEKNLSAVLTREVTVVFAPEMEITDEVVSRLNKEVKSIKVDWAAAKKAVEEAKKKAG